MNPSPSPTSPPLPLPFESLRWRCKEDALSFETTQDVEPIEGVVAQDQAVESLKFGLEINAPGQNIFVRGLSGTGRLTLVRKLVTEIKPSCPLSDDFCYAHNFEQPDAPRLLRLPRKRGRDFAKRIEGLIQFIVTDMLSTLGEEVPGVGRQALEKELMEKIEGFVNPLNEELAKEGLALVSIERGRAMVPALVPLIDGKPISPEDFQKRVGAGTISEEDARNWRQKIEKNAPLAEEVTQNIGEAQHVHMGAVQALHETQIRGLLKTRIASIEGSFPHDSVRHFLKGLVDEVVRTPLDVLAKGPIAIDHFGVHPILSAKDEGCPIIVENTPSAMNLFGVIDREIIESRVHSDHMMIRAGSLLRASGGFLILDGRDLMSEPGAWKLLVRTLKTGLLEPIADSGPGPFQGHPLKPDPIPIKVKVVLLGDSGLYYYLDANDPDFSELFKVLSDFESDIPRNREALAYYAGVISRLARDEGLLPFHRSAVAALVEHGARIASRKDRVTVRFGRLADLAREAAFIAQKDSAVSVIGTYVERAVAQTKRRADLPVRRIGEQIRDGVLRIATEGTAIGEVNGLAVIKAGPLTYGFPTRITASIGPGTAGAINIEREADLSGAIHTKGFYILGGLLRHLLRTNHPLAFSASIAFEQSYGGIDGDSASGAEMCCLLSEITEVPIRQDLAMTGAIDQRGNILPIGAVNEKIEGFFGACEQKGLTGTQGVIIPFANAGELMLRPDIVEAGREGRFHVYAVKSIIEAMALFSGREVDSTTTDGRYRGDSILGIAVRRSREYWEMAQAFAKHES